MAAFGMNSTALIKDKLDQLVSRTVMVALGVAAVILLLYQGWAFRDNILERLSVVSQMAGSNLTAALEFEDRRQADLLLQSVKADKDIVAVSVYDRERQFFAGVNAQGDDALRGQPAPPWTGMDAGGDFISSLLRLTTIEHKAPIRLHGEVVGYIHVRASPNRLFEQWLASLMLILGASLLSGWLAMRGAARLQRRILEPIVALAGSMRQVTREGNFEVRVQSNSQDEVGQLTRGFNDMLAHLQERDRMLADRNRELELAVQQATTARESAEQALRVKSMFLANMSHEIRTPMNGILGLTEILLESPLPEREKEHVRTVLQSGRALLKIINEILDFSKIEAGKLVLSPTNFNLSDFLQELMQLFGHQARQQGLALSLRLEPDTPAWVCADAGRLRQILANLLGNALKFTPAGSVVLNVSNSPLANGAIRLVVEVTDTGIGISAAQHSQIFEEFNQGDSSAARRHGGTGLGLSIAMRLARLMHGSMSVESRQGMGSTFVLKVEVQASSAPSTPQAAWPNATGMLFTACRVLVVDDNMVNQIVAKASLERLGCQVDLADGGAEGVQAARLQHYDLVLMDCQMPEVDGYEATRQIRLRELAQKSARRLPIAALTAHAMAGDREKCKAAGMDDYLSKPMSAAELQQLLLRWLPSADADAERLRPRACDHPVPAAKAPQVL
jgi:signal transduction histidine kinase/ActR/RegA family two-component response regulator